MISGIAKFRVIYADICQRAKNLRYKILKYNLIYLFKFVNYELDMNWALFHF